MRTLTFFQSLVELKFDKCMEGSERTQTMLNYNLSVYIKASASIIYQTLFKAWPLFACFNAYSWKPPKLSSNLPGIGILMLCIASQPFLNNWGVNRVSWTGRPYMGPANQQATLCRWRLLQYKYKDREKWNTTHNHKHKSYTFLNTITSKGPVKILEVLQISYHRYIRQIYLITHILGKYILSSIYWANISNIFWTNHVISRRTLLLFEAFHTLRGWFFVHLTDNWSQVIPI